MESVTTKPTFEVWSESIQCENIEVNRYTNRAVYKLPFGSLELIENEYIPYSVFKKSEFYTWLSGLTIANESGEIKELLKKYKGILIPEFYGEGFQTQFETLEGAYNFAKDNYDNIVKNFWQNNN